MCNCNEIMIELEVRDYDPFDPFPDITYQVIYDFRGYIRLVDKDDKNRLDHGYKFKVNFCPICGSKLESRK